MKLKYYLRGLGIGMLVVALILAISGNKGSGMSDEAVKRRAAELGMVEKDKTVLGDIGAQTAAGENVAPESSAEAADPESGAPENGEAAAGSESGEAADPESSAPESGEAAADPESGAPEPETDAEMQGGTPDADKDEKQPTGDEEKSELAREIEERADEAADRAEETARNSPSGRVVMLEVRRGDSSVSVARRAAEAGLVPSAADFDVFLCRNGYDKRISIGNYEITEGASEEEIADIITKSR